MTRLASLSTKWSQVALTWLPFADAASSDLPLSRLLRLALFQVGVGMTMVLLNGTLNRVMIVELKTPAWLVAFLIALPLLFAPLRALIGHRSDTHRSVLGWRRVPYIWFGTLMQFGGLAIMPFALLLLGRDESFMAGLGGSTLAFLLAGTGLHVTQTAGLALATDLAPPERRPRAVALLYVMLLAGMMISALVIGTQLADFRPTRLVQIVQGAAVLTLVLNITALWKQEPRNSAVIAEDTPRPPFAEVWQHFTAERQTRRLLTAIGLGAAAFAMQDALLEPYGGEVLGLSVGATTSLTGIWALGTLIGFTMTARLLSQSIEPLRVAGFGAVTGIGAFMMVLFAAPLNMPGLLMLGAAAIGLSGGLFAVGTLVAAMSLAEETSSGIALGAWGAVQASGAGLAIALGGLLRDVVSRLAVADGLGTTLADRATGYTTVYLLEIILLVATLVVVGPAVGVHRNAPTKQNHARFGLTEFPT